MQIGADLGRTRSLLLEQTGGSIPMPFLVVLVFWFTVIFITFGLFAPAELNCDRGPVGLRAVGRRRDFPDPGTGSAI